MKIGTFLSAGPSPPLSFHLLPKGLTLFLIYVFQVNVKAISTKSLLSPACTAPFEATEPIFQLPVPPLDMGLPTMPLAASAQEPLSPGSLP